MKNTAHHVKTLILVVALTAFANQSAANAVLDTIYANKTEPIGVVFEIVDWEDEHLAQALPWVNQHIISLRQQFPKLNIAVVSHGSEQFALLKGADGAYPQIHKKAKSLISGHDIKLELCLNHAIMRGFDQTDFPDYVDIEASGPSQISAYQALGYELVLVDLD